MATGNVRATGLPLEVDDWLELVKGLVDNVRAWAEAAGWETRLTSRDMNEKGVARYEVPVLVLDRDEIEVSLVPVARKVPGAAGLVAFYLMPDFDDVASIFEAGHKAADDVTADVDRVRRYRNFLVHGDQPAPRVSIGDAKTYLNRHLVKLPDQWPGSGDDD